MGLCPFIARALAARRGWPADRYVVDMVPTATLIRSPDAAEPLGVDTREVLDLIVAGELEPVRRPDDLYVRSEDIEALRARGTLRHWRPWSRATSGSGAAS